MKATAYSSALIKSQLPLSVQNPPSSASSLCERLLSEKVSKFLLTARERTLLENKNLLSGLADMREFWISEHGGKEIAIPTEDGGIVNGMHVQGAQSKAIIYLHGNGCFYETSLQKPLYWIQSLKQISEEGIVTYPHLVVFNPRGTGKSAGTIHPDSVALDLLAAFQYLVRECQINPDDILIAGHSMGAFFGALGAGLVQQRFSESKINFLSDRSFANIHSRAEFKIKNSDQSMIIHQIYSYGMRYLIEFSKWNRDPITALENLKGRVCIIYHASDSVVPYETSQHAALVASKRSRSYSILSLSHEESESASPAFSHNRDFIECEQNKITAEMKRMLKLPLSQEEQSLSLDLLKPGGAPYNSTTAS